jgi:BirA family biotin operon repressor/biotin-[acetyl-CoA-carboxylase] ligase
LAHNFQTLLEAPVIELQSIDSTNNYAMQLIDADKAQNGMTILAKEQTAGKGQRGHLWQSNAGENLLMSIIIKPNMLVEKQFLFNMSIAVAICGVLKKLCGETPCEIKWPNDLIINDRKAGGILIENVIRGSSWVYSVVGIGINVLQTDFPETLPFATSLNKELKTEVNVMELAMSIRQEVCNILLLPFESNLKRYNQWLYKMNMQQSFFENGVFFTAKIMEVLENGQIVLLLENENISSFSHGEIQWEW